MLLKLKTRTNVSIIIFLLFSGTLFSQEEVSEDSATELLEGGHIQTSSDISRQYQTERLNLKAVIEQGVRESFSQNILELSEKKEEHVWKGAYEKFWVPSLKLELSSSPQKLGRVKSGSKNSNSYDNNPDRQLAIKMGDFTLFNWGIDYLGYLNTKTTYERKKDEVKESKVILKHSLIKNYFTLVIYKEIEAIKKKAVKHATYLYRLAQEKIKSQRITQQEFYQVREEYLRTQREYYIARQNSDTQDEELSRLVIGPSKVRYIPDEYLRFAELRANQDEAINLAKEKAYIVKAAQSEFIIGKRSYDQALKSNLPLPKLSLTLGAFTRDIGNNHNRVEYETYPGNSNIEMVATLNATWTIFGDDGVLNSRKVAKALIDREIALKKLQYASHETDSKIKSLYREIRNYESEIKIISSMVQNSQRLFDINLNNYTQGKVRHSDLRQSLIDLIQNEENLALTKLTHLKSKVDLCTIVGIENFPGESFENLATKKSEE